MAGAFEPLAARLPSGRLLGCEGEDGPGPAPVRGEKLPEIWQNFDDPARAGLGFCRLNDDFVLPNIPPLQLLYLRPAHPGESRDRVKRARLFASTGQKPGDFLWSENRDF